MRKAVQIASILVLAILFGCNGDAQRDAKREQDRAAMQLADAQRQHDADQAEIDQLKAQLDASTRDQAQAKADLDDRTAKLQKASDDLSDKSAKLQKASDDLTAAQTSQATANDEATKKLVESNNALRTQLLDMQSKAMQATDENVKLTKEIDELRGQLTEKSLSGATSEPGK